MNTLRYLKLQNDGVFVFQIVIEYRERYTVIYTGPINEYSGTSSVHWNTALCGLKPKCWTRRTSKETPWTRIIEHKWSTFGKDENGCDLPKRSRTSCSVAAWRNTSITT